MAIQVPTPTPKAGVSLDPEPILDPTSVAIVDETTSTETASDNKVEEPETETETRTRKTRNSNLPIDVKTVDKGQLKLVQELDINDIFNEAVIARPLMFGNSLDFKIKRREYAYHWFNRHAQNGTRYSFAKASGFVNASKDDVEVVNDDTVIDGCIMVGDLILMKMPKLEYMGKLRANHDRAENLINAKTLSENERAKVANMSEVKRAGTDKKGSPKVGIYVPPIGEL